MPDLLDLHALVEAMLVHPYIWMKFPVWVGKHLC